MPRYHFAVSTQLGTTTRTGRKCQTTLPLGTTPSESFGRYQHDGMDDGGQAAPPHCVEIPFGTLEPNNDG